MKHIRPANFFSGNVGPLKTPCLLLVIGWMLLALSGCIMQKPLDLPQQMAQAPAEDQLWSELATVRSEDWFELLNTGQEALTWRLRAIDSATRTLDLQTFLWLDDPTGRSILRHIFDAADAGVRVRLLIDDTFTANQDAMIFAIDRHPNIELRIYNPFRRRYDDMVMRQLLNMGEFARLDHRMHNKVMIVDNQAALIGGRNLADEYFGNHPTFNFRDMEVIAVGPVAASISRHFDDYWNSGWSFPADRLPIKAPPQTSAQALRAHLKGSADRGLAEDQATRSEAWRRLALSAFAGEARLIADRPARMDPAAPEELPNQLALALMPWIDRAQKEIVMVSAYFIPTPELEAAIERAERRGVRVRILTNSLRSNNHTAAHSFYRGHLERLLGHGADVHEVRARAKDRSTYMRTPVEAKDLGLHAKLMLIDDTHAFVGSANLDPRSLHLNTEIGILIESPSFNRRLRENLALDFHKRNAWHLQTNEEGELVWVGDDTVLSSQPAESQFQLLEDWFLGILPMEEEM
jgi:putative cardiolipin synthase